jgi:hypothetical protein
VRRTAVVASRSCHHRSIACVTSLAYVVLASLRHVVAPRRCVVVIHRWL